MLPRSSSRFITSCTLPTPWRCCVRPIAQQAIVRSALRVELGELAHLAPRDARSPPRAPRTGTRRAPSRSSRSPWCARRGRRGRAPRPALGLEREQLLHHALEQRDVAADAHAHEALGQLRAGAEQPSGLLRMLEAHEPALAQRVHAHDAAAAARGLLQRGEHARVVGARVLPDHEDQIGLREVREQTVPLPTPIISPSPTPLDSWHMFEQSGRLFVPNSRTKS